MTDQQLRNVLLVGVPGVGTCGVGAVGAPGTYRLRPDLCAHHDHPGVTYNPCQGRTWCLCGEVIRDGNAVSWPKADGIGGPLREVIV